MADKDLGTSLTDFLVDLIGGDSDVKMKGMAAGAGFDSKSKDLLQQLQAAIQKSQDAGPLGVDNDTGGRLGTPTEAAMRHKDHLSLLSSLNDFYSKKFGPAVK